MHEVEHALQQAELAKWQEDRDLLLCILPTAAQPTAVLCQEGPLLWIHPHSSPAQSIEHYPTAAASLALTGIQRSLQHFGKQPDMIIVPYTSHQVSVLCGAIDDWAILRCSFTGPIDNHFPKHPLLQFFREHPVIFPKVTSSTPLKVATNILTDGS